MSSLTDCLAQNSALLGPNLENLGKTVSNGCCFWNRYKIFLSCTKDNGWKIEKLNLFYVLLRKIFGCFQNTHFSWVTKQINKLSLTDPTQKEAIDRITEKTSPVICLGNAPLSQARVICFAGDHTDHQFRLTTEKIIAKLWKKGDLVLTEGVKANCKVKNNSLLRRGAPDAYDVEGFEPPNIKELLGTFGWHQATAHVKKVSSCLSELQKCMPDLNKGFAGNPFTPEEKSRIKKQLNITKSILKEENKWFKSTGPKISNIDHNFDVFFQLVEGNKLTGIVLLALVSETTGELVDHFYEAYNNTISPKQYNTLLKVADTRNDSLITQVNQKAASSPKRKIFVITGGAHILQIPSAAVKSYQKVQNALKTYPFCILTRKKFGATEIAPLNPDLQQFPL